LIDCYPTDVELDTVGKFLTWQCLPKLPDIDDQRIIDAIQDIKISKEDQSRAKLSQKFQIK
jgi:5'-3' exonuclease